MDEKGLKIEDLNEIVELFEEGKQLTDEELARFMQDQKAMRAYRDLLACKSAVMERYSPDNMPDISAEWERFELSNPDTTNNVTSPMQVIGSSNETPDLVPLPARKSHRFFWGALSGVAATIIIILVYSWVVGFPLLTPKKVVAFEAVDGEQQVMLQTSVGNRIALLNNTPNDKLGAVGTLIHKKDTLELAYNTSSVGSPLKTDEVETHLLSTPRGQDFRIVLEDGTIVWMNAESSLEYPSRFVGNERKVRLHGEAYFKVKKDPSHPFIIQTDRMTARVLGTELNVRSYVSSDSHVTLINGRVEVASGQSSKPVSLQPGEDAQLMDGGSFVVQEVDVDTYTYWKDGYFYFDDVSLNDVMQSLGRWYNINVVFDSKDLMDLRIRYFCVRGETLERAITLLNHMKKIRATLSGNTVYIR